MNEILIYLQNKCLGKWMEIYNSLQRREKLEVKDIKKALECVGSDRNIATLISDNYPKFLKEWYKPPFMVELIGDKVYYIYGKNLSKKWEIKNGNDKPTKPKYNSLQEQKYVEFIENL